MKPELVRFQSRPGRFRVRVSRCDNPECGCAKTTFRLGEVFEPGGAATEPLVFQVRIDGRTWEEIDPPARPAEVARLIDEFLRLPGRGKGRRCRRIARRSNGAPGG